jgi:NitT/TauT family transport system permease protein
VAEPSAKRQDGTNVAVAALDPNAGVKLRTAAGGAFFRLGPPIVFAIALLVVWQVGVEFYKVKEIVLPTPTAIFTRAVDVFPLLIKHAWPTTYESLIGFVFAGVFGITLATILVYSPIIRAAIYPTVVFFQLIPKIALAPLFIVWLGIGTESRLAFSLFISFFPIVIATAAGLISVPSDMLRLCRSLTATEWQIFASVRFPYAVPYIFSGMKIAVTFAMIGLIVGEFITAQEGLGYLILFGASQADTPLIMAAIAVLCVVGLLMYASVAFAELCMLRWFGHS